jgi:hypothetical protein
VYVVLGGTDLTDTVDAADERIEDIAEALSDVSTVELIEPVVINTAADAGRGTPALRYRVTT